MPGALAAGSAFSRVPDMVRGRLNEYGLLGEDEPEDEEIADEQLPEDEVPEAEFDDDELDDDEEPPDRPATGSSGRASPRQRRTFPTTRRRRTSRRRVRPEAEEEDERRPRRSSSRRPRRRTSRRPRSRTGGPEDEDEVEAGGTPDVISLMDPHSRPPVLAVTPPREPPAPAARPPSPPRQSRSQAAEVLMAEDDKKYADHPKEKEADRYRKAAEDALQQLDWAIGYLHGIHKTDISLAKNRSSSASGSWIATNSPTNPANQRKVGEAGGAQMAAIGQPTSRGYLEAEASGLADVVDIILDKGIVIDAYVRVALIGIEILTIDAEDRHRERRHLRASRRRSTGSTSRTPTTKACRS